MDFLDRFSQKFPIPNLTQNESSALPRWYLRAEGRAAMTEITVALRDYANPSKNNQV